MQDLGRQWSEAAGAGAAKATLARELTPAKVRLAMASMGKPDTKVGELCKELGISRQTLYRHVTPNGEARPDGVRVLSRK